MQIIQPSSNALLYSPNKYPYATDPNVIAEGRSYNNWLDTCVGVGDGTRSPEAYAIAEEAVGLSIDILAEIIYYLGFPIASPLTRALSAIAGQLFSSGDTLMQHIEQLINQKIAEYARNKALAEFQGLGRQYGLYLEALEDWEQNRLSQPHKERVRQTFRILDNSFTSSIPSFAVRNYEVPLLSVYADAANLHLLILRDSYIYGAFWGFDEDEYYRNYARQIRLSAEYANHCTTWYQTGLRRLQGTRATDWINYNRFRREMTLTVLDICALFSSYDIPSYPMGTKIQLTREIYTDPVVHSDWLQSTSPGLISFSSLENLVVRAPHLFTWLSRVTIDTGILSTVIGGQYSNNNFWRTHYQTLRTTGGTSFQSPTYGSTAFPIQRTNTLTFSGDVYTIESSVVTRSSLYGANSVAFTGTTGRSLYENPTVYPFAQKLIHELPGVDSGRPNATNYSHRLSYISGFSLGYSPSGTGLVYGWTSTTATRENNITLDDRIVQLPAVKGASLNNCQVVKGTGFTGGDWLKPNNNGTFSMYFAFRSAYTYHFRIRYASSASFSFVISEEYGRFPTTTVPLLSTMSPLPQNTPFEAFKTVDLPSTVTIRYTSAASTTFQLNFRFTVPGSANVLIDRIEFVPIEGSLFEYETKQQLEKARKAVNHLFTDGSKKALKEDTTDYEIDQAANVVDCISDECGHEKMILLDEVKYAKQLSQARNLLLNGNFDDLYPALERENPWKTSPNVTIRQDNPIFKGHYLSMAGANDIEATNDTFPTYVYQKIDEAKLKPYTRYKVRGFVGSSKDLELLVTRYNEEVDAILDVPDNIPHAPTPVCGEFDRCKPYSYPPLLPECNPEFINQMQPSSCHHNQMVDYNNMNTSTSTTMNPSMNPPLTPEIASSQSGFGRKHRKCHQAHQFEFHIDTGTIDLVEDLGIWVIFKICATDGYASLDDLEVIEEGALGVEALELVKKREKKWRHQKEQHCSQTKHKYDAAKHAVMALFTNTRYEKLKFETTISDILYADHLVQSIPYVYNKYVPEVSGMNYELYTELNTLVQNAFYLYDQRNLIKNGRFSNGLMYWQATPHARVEQEYDRSVLVLPNWDANVSQQLCIEHNRGYVLRVTARKEDPGAGNVTFSDCANHVDKLSFTSCDIATNAVPGAQANDPAAGVAYGQQGCQIDRVPYGPSGYRADGVAYEQSGHRTDGVPYRQSGYRADGVAHDQPGYRADGVAYEQSGYRADGVAYEQSGHRADGVPYGQSGYGTDGVTYDQSAKQTRKYHGCHTDGLPHPEHGCCYPDRVSDGQQLAYVTKSIDLFPDTDKVRIDIGETEGNFRVESVELICMEK
uniref:Parasporal crystal protein n=1 Tax=Paenibacillus lentimorbus TaxID=78058 RepID=Q765X5_9BACL|nr:parasporal crystal protein [Paenibacillus lentimorbus]